MKTSSSITESESESEFDALAFEALLKKSGTVVKKQLTAFQYWHDYCEKAIRISEDYQRHSIWSIKSKSELIEAAILGYSIGSLLIWSPPGSWWVQDGGQRSRAIWDFRNDQVELTGLQILPQLNGRTYEALPEIVKRAFNNYELNLEICENVPVETLAKMVAGRNLKGTPMNPMEIINFRHDSDFLARVRKLAEYPPFKALVGKVNVKRMEDRKLVLRGLFGIEEFLNVSRKDTNWKMLTAFADKWDKASNQEYQDLENRFKEVIQTALEVFGPNAPFREDRSRVVHEGVYHAVMTSLALYNKQELINARKEVCKALGDLIMSNQAYPVPSGSKRVRSMLWIELASRDGWSRMHRLYEIWSEKLDKAIVQVNGKTLVPAV